MAYSAAGITKIANLLNLANKTDNTPGLFYYVTSDTLATILGAGYFNGAVGLSLGSIIEVYCANGKQSLTVSAISGAGVVTVGSIASMARGQSTTVAAVDTIVTGLAGPLLGVVATFDADPIDDPEFITASIGNQSGAPASGSFYLKTWKNTGGTDPTPLAATTFGKKVNWLAW